MSTITAQKFSVHLQYVLERICHWIQTAAWSYPPSHLPWIHLEQLKLWNLVKIYLIVIMLIILMFRYINAKPGGIDNAQNIRTQTKFSDKTQDTWILLMNVGWMWESFSYPMFLMQTLYCTKLHNTFTFMLWFFRHNIWSSLF